MKQLLIIFIGILFSFNSFAQGGDFTKTRKTPSEIKAQELIEKLNQQVILEELQKQILLEITSDYFDEIQEISGSENYAEEFAKLTTKRDNHLKSLLKNEVLLSEYQKCVAVMLYRQRKGYGRG